MTGGHGIIEGLKSAIAHARGLPMSEIKVGMKLKRTSAVTSAFPVITVTEITERGFRYEHEPYTYGSRIGTACGGEWYGVDCYSLHELA